MNIQEALIQLEPQINAFCLEELMMIQNDAEQILKNAIQNKVYSYYQPTWYKRTNQLLNSVRTEVVTIGGNNILKVFVDAELLDYISVYGDRNVSAGVPNWVEKGHETRNLMVNNYNQFHSYEGREYIEEAFQELNLKYRDLGFIIQIDEDISSYQ